MHGINSKEVIAAENVMQFYMHIYFAPPQTNRFARQRFSAHIFMTALVGDGVLLCLLLMAFNYLVSE